MINNNQIHYSPLGVRGYLKAHYSPETAKAYQREIEGFLGNFKAANEANYKQLTEYIGQVRSRYKNPSTVNRILSSIKVYYDYLCNENIRTDNPAKAIQLKDQRSRDIQLQDLFTTEELEVLLYRKERFFNLELRNKVLISLMIYQALQPREIETLTLENINLIDGTIYIKSTPKTNARELSLKPNQILLFQTYIEETRKLLLKENPSNSMIIGLTGESMKAEDITKHVKRSFKSLYPNRKINAQTIRQSVITNLLKNNQDLSLVQAFAGHKYPSTTERYKTTEIESLQAAVNKYHPFSREP